ncbi:MAG: hypothetical protein AAGU27_06940 [Dehalobacterium sp.]
MWEVISLGGTLFLLAVIYPPYNVFIAQSFFEKNLILYLIVVISSIIGVILGGLILEYGTRLLGLPLELLGGIFIIIVGLKMLWPKKSQSNEKKLNEQVSVSVEAAFSCFLMSVMPGVFTISMGTGLSTANAGQISAVLIGATLGINSGGILLYKGASLANLPIDKLGGVLLLFVGILTLL